MTTDVHQQRQEARPFKGVRLFEGEVARPLAEGGFTRVDVCIHCDVNGPPRRPQGAPQPLEAPAI